MTRLHPLALVALVVATVPPACATGPHAQVETRPNELRGEAPHIELKLSATNVMPGRKVYAKAYGRGDLRGGWRCTAQSWRGDGGWLTDGHQADTPCAEIGETWIWPEGLGKEFVFTSPGEHEVCVAVHDRHGRLIGLRPECVRLDVVRMQ